MEGCEKMNNRTITVRGSAKVSAAPDWVVISFNLEAEKYDYTQCMDQLARQTESLREELVTVGLEKESLKTSHFNIDTNFDWVNQRHVFRGYKASHDLKVEFPFEKDYLNEVLRVLGQTQSQASFRISFQIKDTEPLRQQAIAGAVKNCRDKAQILVDAAGVTLGELIQIDYSWSEIHIQPRMEVCAMSVESSSPAYDITPEDVDVSDSVTVIWAIK